MFLVFWVVLARVLAALILAFSATLLFLINFRPFLRFLFDAPPDFMYLRHSLLLLAFLLSVLNMV